MKKLMTLATLLVSGVGVAAQLEPLHPVLEPQGIVIATPHLTPYRPSGWSDKIVVSNVSHAHTDASSLLPTDNINLAWAVRNDGGAATTVTFDIDVIVDGFVVEVWHQPPPLNIGEYTYTDADSIGHLSAGSHTIAIRADPNFTVSEPASDRYYERTIFIGPTGGCMPSATALCLLSGRFRVSVAWNNQHSPGQTGNGQAVSDTDQTGFFWFFASSSKELVVKLIDGGGFNGKFWVFYGALSDVEYTITVTDTLSSTVRTYHNPPGNICGGADTSAFPSP
jgi:hypothetical protein